MRKMDLKGIDKPENKCALGTPENEWKACLTSFPAIVEANKGSCPFESGTEPRRCVYDI